MIIKDAIVKYHEIEIDVLLSHLLGKPKEFVFLNPEFRLTRMQADRLTRMVKRRLRGEPVAYILGYKDFYGLRFKVNRNVLIPRPETEKMVEMVLDVVQGLALPSYRQAMGLHYSSAVKILDLGTGSGCIIISLMHTLQAKLQTRGTLVQHEGSPRYELYASDISLKALTVARQNAKILLPARRPDTSMYQGKGQKIKFVKSDLLEGVRFNPDIIIANLPYGWDQWKNNTTAETAGLKFEPKQALFTKDRGLYQISRLLRQIAQRPQKPKLVLLEFDPRQKQALAATIKKYLPKASVKFTKDFNGSWRFAIISS